MGTVAESPSPTTTTGKTDDIRKNFAPPSTKTVGLWDQRNRCAGARRGPLDLLILKGIPTTSPGVFYFAIPIGFGAGLGDSSDLSAFEDHLARQFAITFEVDVNPVVFAMFAVSAFGIPAESSTAAYPYLPSPVQGSAKLEPTCNQPQR